MGYNYRCTKLSFFLQEWDTNLAYDAEFWADNCVYDYNEDRHDQSTEFDYVGQNIIATDETNINYTILMGGWFKQRSRYNYYTGVCVDENGDESENLEGCEGYSQVSATLVTYRVMFQSSGIICV